MTIKIHFYLKKKRNYLYARYVSVYEMDSYLLKKIAVNKYIYSCEVGGNVIACFCA